MKDHYKNQFFFIPFLLFLIPIIVYHIEMYIVGEYGDDVGVLASINDQHFIDYIISRYFGHSSRVAGDLLTAFFVQKPFICFLVCNTFVWIVLYRIIIVLVAGSNKMVQYIFSFILLCYPFVDTLSAGPIATTTNYLWTLTSLLFLVYIHRNKKKLEKKRFLWAFVVFALFECCLFQLSVVLFLSYLLFSQIACYVKQKTIEIDFVNLTFVLCSLLGLVIILSSPATEHRLAMEVPYLNPLFCFT